MLGTLLQPLAHLLLDDSGVDSVPAFIQLLFGNLGDQVVIPLASTTTAHRTFRQSTPQDLQRPYERGNPVSVEIRCQLCQWKSGVSGNPEIRCQFIILARKDELTSRQESSGKEDSRKLETFQMEPCG